MNLSSYIDHTLLKPELPSAIYEGLCDTAITHQFFSVCVPPHFVTLAERKLRDTQVKVCSVVGFPLGYTVTSVKAFETQRLLDLGATEIDMVMNIAAFKSAEFNLVKDDIHSVFDQLKPAHLLKVIIETAYLDESEIIKACQICESVGVQFVKTSTGFAPSGAVLENVRLMRKTLNPKIKIKASGGIQTKSQALAFIEAGADRLGTSSGVKIVTEQ